MLDKTIREFEKTESKTVLPSHGELRSPEERALSLFAEILHGPINIT